MSGRAIYTDFDPRSIEALGNLERARMIPPGEVRGADINDIEAASLDADQVHMFAGVGVWPLALAIAGWPVDVPVWTASCPCQPFSSAGRRKGFEDDRHLWPVVYRLIALCHPPVVFGEQVAGTAGAAWFARVRSDLERAGYAVGCCDLPAACVGAPHRRHRLFFVAVADAAEQRSQGGPHADLQPAAGRGGVHEVGDDDGRDLLPDAVGNSGARGRDRGEERNGQAAAGGSAGDLRRDDRGLGVVSDAVAEPEGQRRRGGQRETLGRPGPRAAAQRPVSGDRAVGDAGKPRLERQSGLGAAGDEPGRLGEGPHGPTAQTSWDDCLLVRCVEPTASGGSVERVRRISSEPGAFPLVDGPPAGIAVSPRSEVDGPAFRLKDHGRTNIRVINRAAALHGIGNAICLPVATDFIGAAMETLGLAPDGTAASNLEPEATR